MTDVGSHLSTWVRRPWAWVLAVLLLLALLAALLRFAPIFGVERVAVEGNKQVSADEVLAAAAVPSGAAVLTAPLAQIAARVESLDAVAEAQVERDWPNGLVIVVQERRPIGYVALADGAGLVGSDGTVYRIEHEPPTDLPQLPDAAVSAVGDPYRSRLSPTAIPAFEVAVSLPHRLRVVLTSIETDGDGRVRLTTDDGVTVVWGESSANRLKAEVVDVLRQRAGWGTAVTWVDVTTPDAPALR